MVLNHVHPGVAGVSMEVASMTVAFELPATLPEATFAVARSQISGEIIGGKNRMGKA